MVVEIVNGTELRFKNPGRLLLVVFAFIFWGVGFLDLLGHTSAEPDIFGLYSLPFFVLLILYGCTIVIWFVLFFNSNILSRVVDIIRYIQSKTWLVLTAFAGLGIAQFVIFEWDRWARLPGLQFAAFGLVLLVVFILLFTDWNERNGQQTWRRVIAYPLLALLIVEATLQIMAWLGGLPGTQTIGGDFYPYERVYYNGEGFRNGFANRYGWYYPDYSLDDEKKRILIVGGSYVQALHIQPEQQVSVLLSERINGDRIEPPVQTEVIAIGMPGFGLSPFLYNDVMNELPALINIDEMVVFFHLGDDFQSPSDADTPIRYSVSDTGEIDIHPEDGRLRHDLTHYYLRAYMSFQLVETIRTNYLTPRVISSLFDGRNGGSATASAAAESDGPDFPRLVGSVSSTYAITESTHAGIKTTDLAVISRGNNFIFMQGENADVRKALEIADSLLGTAQDIARSQSITLRVVTIPMFPEEFYRSSQAENWNSQFGEYNLFLPEKALVEIAQKHDISILPMGQYMLEEGLSLDEIEALYMPNSQGSFTAKGHEYFAGAIYSCFYTDAADSFCSK
jgi:hypothetical protein